jgi:hypothetical protein
MLSVITIIIQKRTFTFSYTLIILNEQITFLYTLLPYTCIDVVMITFIYNNMEWNKNYHIIYIISIQ